MRRPSFTPVDPPADPNFLIKRFGVVATWLRDKWILAVVVFLAALGAVVAPALFTDKNGDPTTASIFWSIVLVGLTAFAALIDRLADETEAHNKLVRKAEESAAAEAIFKASEDSAEWTARDLVTFLGAVHRVPHALGPARTSSIENLPTLLTLCAANIVGSGARATYYTLSRDGSGLRFLGDPRHYLGYKRTDTPDQPFIESVDPDHPIWKVLDKQDMEAHIFSDNDPVYGLDWARKDYKTFVSIPVKRGPEVFGMLSVNSSELGSIGPTQRATLVAMARTMASVLAADVPN